MLTKNHYHLNELPSLQDTKLSLLAAETPTKDYRVFFVMTKLMQRKAK